MIRKLFAALSVLIFIILLTPLLLLQSVSMSFFDRSSVENKLVSESYELVVDLLIEQASKTSGDRIIFKRRFQQAFTKEMYVTLLNTLSKTLFEGKNYELDFTSFKSEILSSAKNMVVKLPNCLQDEGIDSFRFCKPNVVGFEQKYLFSLEKSLNDEIPDKYSFKDSKDPRALQAIDALLMLKKYLPLLIVGVSALMIAIIGLLIFSPAFSVLKWIGFSFLGLSAVVFVFYLIFAGLLKTLPDISEFTSSQSLAVAFLLNVPLEKIKFIAYITGATGIIAFVSGIILKTRK